DCCDYIYYYIFNCIFSTISVLFIVSIVIFLIVNITPGNPSSVILGEEATATQIAKLEESLGLNLPIHEQYLTWVGGVFKGDLGMSYFMKEPVTQSISSHLAPTLSLALLAQIIALVIAIPIGVIAADRKSVV